MDIISETSGIRLGVGWAPPARSADGWFRWADPDAVFVAPVIERIEHRVRVEWEDVRIGGAPGERKTLEIYLPGEPKIHEMRFNVRDVPVRVFAMRFEPLRPEVVPLLAGFRLGSGWYLLEESAGENFRWVKNDAQIRVTDPSAKKLELDVAPGPGQFSQTPQLTVLDGGDELVSVALENRRRVSLQLRPREIPYVITLHVAGEGIAMPGHPRVLNFRAFHVPAT